MGSSRLSCKVMEDLGGEPMLARVVNRAMQAKTLDGVIVATTSQPIDDAIANLCDERGWVYFRGSEDDVLDRYYQTALMHNLDTIVRITADCPLIDPTVIDRVVRGYEDFSPDYASNILIRTFPRGLDTEVMSFKTLKRAWTLANSAFEREHVTPYIWKNPEIFKLHNTVSDIDYSHLRWTVDFPDDLVFVRRIYDYFKNDTFIWREVLNAC